MRDYSFHDLIGINIVCYDLLFQLILPRFMDDLLLLLLALLIAINLRIKAAQRAFERLILLFFFLIFLLLFYLIDFEIVFFIGHLLPVRYIDCIFSIHIYFFLTYLLQILPLLSLFLTHHVANGWLVSLYLRQVIYKARVSCLLADVDSPHIKIFAIRVILLPIRLIILLFFSYEVFGKKEILLFRELDRGSELPLCPFSDELMNSCFSASDNTGTVILDLLFERGSFFGFGDIGRRQECILFISLSLFFFFLLNLDALELNSLGLILKMVASLFMLLDILFVVRDVYPAVFAPLFASHLLQSDQLQTLVIQSSVIVIIQMKPNPISFADVLKKKEKGYQSGASRQLLSLEDMLAQWELNPAEDFTLYLGPLAKKRTSHMLKSNNTSKGGMFDSWIQRQALDNKQNTDSVGNIYSKDYKIEYGPKKIVLNSKGKSVKTFGERVRINESIKNERAPTEEIQLISSKEYSNQNMSHSSCHKTFKNQELSIEIDDNPRSFKQERSINQSPNNPKKTMQMRDLKNIKKEQAKFSQTPKTDPPNHQGKIKVGELQQLVNQTDHIHEEIAELAHRLVLEEKKKSENQDEELLLSVEGTKKYSGEESKQQTSQKYNYVQPPKEEDSKDTLREQVKRQIGNFLKNSQLRTHVPTFGAKKASVTELPSPKQVEKAPVNTNSFQTSDKKANAEVGYSFATNMYQGEPQRAYLEPQEIPMLQIMQAPTIPLIQEIASQRHHSETNEQIQNMYSKWRRQEDNHFDSEHVKDIESVSFYRLPEFDHGRPQPNSNENKITVLEGQKSQKIAAPERQQQGRYQNIPQPEQTEVQAEKEQISGKKSSAGKPEIVINIPLDYNEQENQSHLFEKKNGSQKDYGTRSGVLCLSQSSKKSIELNNQRSKTAQQNEHIQLFTHQNSLKKGGYNSAKSNGSNNSPSLASPAVHPSRGIYLSNAEENQPELSERIEPQKIEINSQFKIDKETESEKKVEIESNLKREPQIVKQPKQSPSQQFKLYSLNKVYSNEKKEIPIAATATSDFCTLQIQPRKQQVAPVQISRPDYNHFSFGHQHNPMSNLGIESKEKDQSKKSSGTKITLVGSNKSKEKATCKVESYAHTSMFTTNLTKATPLELAPSFENKEEENEEFNFDF